MLRRLQGVDGVSVRSLQLSPEQQEASPGGVQQNLNRVVQSWLNCLSQAVGQFERCMYFIEYDNLKISPNLKRCEFVSCALDNQKRRCRYRYSMPESAPN